MTGKKTLTLLVDVPTVYIHTYRVKVDVEDIPEDELVLHRRNPVLKERVVAAARKVLANGGRHVGRPVYSHREDTLWGRLRGWPYG